MSPHEMSTPKILERIAQIRRMLDKGLDPVIEKAYRWRLGQFENIIRERAQVMVH